MQQSLVCSLRDVLSTATTSASIWCVVSRDARDPHNAFPACLWVCLVPRGFLMYSYRGDVPINRFSFLKGGIMRFQRGFLAEALILVLLAFALMLVGYFAVADDGHKGFVYVLALVVSGIGAKLTILGILFHL